MAKVRIEANGGRARIFIDGQEVHDVKGYSIDHYAGEWPVLKLDLVTETIEFEGDGIDPEVVNDAEDHAEPV